MLEDEHMVRNPRYCAQRSPHAETVSTQDLLEAGPRHSGTCIEHRGARGHEDARDLRRHRADVSFGQVVAHDACRMH